MRRIARAAALLLAALFLLAACAPAQSDYYVGFTLGSVYVGGKAVSSAERAEASSEVAALLHAIEDEISVERADSDVSRINGAAAGERVAVGEHTYAILSLCKELYAQTGGAFSPALYNLSELWGFTPEFEGQYTVPRAEPSAQAIEEALELSDFDDIALHEDGTVSKAKSGTRIDLGGVAKGYMSDAAASLLEGRFGASADAHPLRHVQHRAHGGKSGGRTPNSATPAAIENPRAPRHFRQRREPGAVRHRAFRRRHQHPAPIPTASMCRTAASTRAHHRPRDGQALRKRRRHRDGRRAALRRKRGRARRRILDGGLLYAAHAGASIFTNGSRARRASPPSSSPSIGSTTSSATSTCSTAPNTRRWSAPIPSSRTSSSAQTRRTRPTLSCPCARELEYIRTVAERSAA